MRNALYTLPILLGAMLGSASVGASPVDCSESYAGNHAGDPECPVVELVDYTPPGYCDANERYIIVTASGGLAPLQYSIDGVNFQESPAFTGLENGIYPVYVRNADGSCENIVQVVTLNVPLRITIDSISVFDITGCDVLDGVMEVHYGGGGTPPIEYSINGVNFQTSTQFNNLGPGNYTLFVRNADDSCLREEADFVIAQPIGPLFIMLK